MIVIPEFVRTGDHDGYVLADFYPEIRLFHVEHDVPHFLLTLLGRNACAFPHSGIKRYLRRRPNP